MRKKILIIFAIISSNILCADFETSFNKTIKYEGSNIVNSKFGEYSRFGITKNTLSVYNKKNKTNYTIKKLNKNLAKIIYKANYWNLMKLNELNNQELANNIFDYGVNSGIGKASYDLQNLCNDLIYQYDINIENIDVDGIIGSKTIETINNILKHEKIEIDTVISKYKNKRLLYLQTLGEKWNVYGKGWTYRVNSI